MKLAINTNCLPGGPRDALPAIHELRCLDVEISTNTCKDSFEPLNGVAEMLKANDQRCVCFSGGWTDLARGNHDRFHVQALIARKLGAPYLRMFASNPRDEVESWDSFKRLLDELSYLRFISSCNGFPEILIENEGGLTATIDMMVQLFNEGNSNFGLVLDPANLITCWMKSPTEHDMEEEMFKAVYVLRSWIRHVHLKDIDEDGQYCRLGDGIVPWKEILTHLNAINYSGYVALEHVVGTSDYEENLAENWRRAKELVACVQR